MSTFFPIHGKTKKINSQKRSTAHYWDLSGCRWLRLTVIWKHYRMDFHDRPLWQAGYSPLQHPHGIGDDFIIHTDPWLVVNQHLFFCKWRPNLMKAFWGLLSHNAMGRNPHLIRYHVISRAGWRLAWVESKRKP